MFAGDKLPEGKDGVHLSIFGIDPLEIILIAGASASFWCLTAWLRQRRFGSANSASAFHVLNEGLIVAAIVGILMVTLTTPVNFTPQVRAVNLPNLVPFDRAFDAWVHSRNSAVMLRNVVGNIILFVPLGCFLASRWAPGRGAMSRTIFIGAMLSVVVETLQVIIPLRMPDIDDLILNTIGTAIGARAGLAIGRRVYGGRLYRRQRP